MITFACVSPHPPIILPSISSKQERAEVNITINSLRRLGKDLKAASPQLIVISSPHQNWGFDVPLHFLTPKIFAKTKTFLTGTDPAIEYFDAGKKFFKNHLIFEKRNIALIASGNLSHRLKIDGPYGLHPDGAKFDKGLINGLKRKDIGTIFGLDDKYPEAGECGLRAICFAVGILEAAKINWNINILSYEAPFGVGYLVAKFKL